MHTTIRIDSDIRDRILNMAKKGQTYEEFITELMDIIEKHLTESNCEHCLNLFRSVFGK
jgi:hypothetical protein